MKTLFYVQVFQGTAPNHTRMDDAELRAAYEATVAMTRAALETLRPQTRKRTRRRQEIASKLQERLGQDPEAAKHLARMAKELRGVAPPEEPRAPGELL